MSLLLNSVKNEDERCAERASALVAPRVSADHTEPEAGRQLSA